MADSIVAARGTEAEPADRGVTGRRIARNVGAFAVAQLAVRLSSLGLIVVVARTLSPADFGRYSVALALSAMITLVVESGMGGYLVREGTQDPGRMGIALGHVLSIQAITGTLAIALCAGVAVVLDYDRETFLATVLLALGSVLLIVQRSFMAVVVSVDRAPTSARFQSGQAIASTLLVLAAALAGAGPAGLGLAVLAGSVLSFPVAYRVLRRHWRLPLRFQRAGLWQTVGVGAAYSATRLGNALLTYVDAVMVQALRGNVAAAHYGAAYRLLLALRMFPLVYTDALSQPNAHLAKTDRERLGRVLNRAASQLFIVGLPLGLGGFILAEPIMATVFGSSYAVAGEAVAILFLTLVLSFPVQIMLSTCLSLGLERRVAAGYFGTVAVNVGMNFVLIPAYGITGAAMTMLVSVVMNLVLATTLLRSKGMPFTAGRRVLKAVVASAGLVATVLAARSLPLPVVILLGAGVYVALTVALRTLEDEDLEMLPMGRRLGWLVRRPRGAGALG